MTAANGVGSLGFDVYATMLNLTDVTITGNASSGVGPGQGMTVRPSAGGLPSSVDVLNCRITGNATAIYMRPYGGTVNIVDSTVSNNFSNETVSGSGGYTNEAAISVQRYNTLTITGSSITGNVANGVSTKASGGAINATGPEANVTITNSTIANNSANGVGGGIGTKDANLTISNSVLSGNTGDVGGGALYAYGSGTIDISNCTLSGNTAGGNGGAVAAVNFGGTINLSNSTIAKNTAGGSGGSGGGILLQGFQGDLGFTSCTVTANSSS